MILTNEEKAAALRSIMELAETLDIQHIGLDKPVIEVADGKYADSHVRIITILGTVRPDGRSAETFDMPTESLSADDYDYEVVDDDDGG